MYVSTCMYVTEPSKLETLRWIENALPITIVSIECFLRRQRQFVPTHFQSTVTGKIDVTCIFQILPVNALRSYNGKIPLDLKESVKKFQSIINDFNGKHTDQQGSRGSKNRMHKILANHNVEFSPFTITCDYILRFTTIKMGE